MHHFTEHILAGTLCIVAYVVLHCGRTVFEACVFDGRRRELHAQLRGSPKDRRDAPQQFVGARSDGTTTDASRRSPFRLECNSPDA